MRGLLSLGRSKKRAGPKGGREVGGGVFRAMAATGPPEMAEGPAAGLPLRPIPLLRLSLLRFVDSQIPGYSLRT